MESSAEYYHRQDFKCDWSLLAHGPSFLLTEMKEEHSMYMPTINYLRDIDSEHDQPKPTYIQVTKINWQK